MVIAETAAPTAVRRTVAFSEAVFDESAHVEGVTGMLIGDQDSAWSVWKQGGIPVIVDPSLDHILNFRPNVLVDAMMAKANRGMHMGLAPGTVGLGPGFIGGADVHAVVETNRGPDLGRVIWRGTAEPNTHVPGVVAGHSSDRVLRAPASGPFRAEVSIGAIVREGQTLGTVTDSVVRAPFDGLVRGLVRTGLDVMQGMKIGDVDPRLDPTLCDHVSDKAMAVAGGVVEASAVLLRRAGWEWRRS